jgi:hypothetical protein
LVRNGWNDTDFGRQETKCYRQNTGNRPHLVDGCKAVSATKIRNDQKVLKSFFNFLQEQDLWPDNTVKGMKLIKVESYGKPQRKRMLISSSMRGVDQRDG